MADEDELEAALAELPRADRAAMGARVCFGTGWSVPDPLALAREVTGRVARYDDLEGRDVREDRAGERPPGDRKSVV